MYSGGDATAPSLIELCYSEKPVVYNSFGNKMFLKFHSDVTYGARGFNASYKSVPLTCGGKFTADSGVIYSTNYPQNYPHMQNCEWLLQVNQNYLVNLTFSDFDLENSANCTDDYVKVRETLIQRFPQSKPSESIEIELDRIHFTHPKPMLFTDIRRTNEGLALVGDPLSKPVAATFRFH